MVKGKKRFRPFDLYSGSERSRCVFIENKQHVEGEVPMFVGRVAIAQEKRKKSLREKENERLELSVVVVVHHYHHQTKGE